MEELDLNIECDLFYLFNNKLFIWDRSSKLISEFSDDYRTIVNQSILNDSISKIYNFDNQVFTISSNGLVYKTSSSLDTFEAVDSDIITYQSDIVFNKNSVITTSKDYTFDNPRMVHHFDLQKGTYSWSQNINSRYIYFKDNFLIVDDSVNGIWKIVKSLSILDGSVLWQADLGSSIKAYLGVDENIIIVKCEDYTIGIDKHTGKILWNYDLCHIYDPHSRSIFYLGGEKFISLNPKNGQIQEEIQIDSNYFYATRQSPIIFQGNIVTTNRDSKEIGFFNINKKEFMQKIKLEKGFVLGDSRHMQCTNRNIFILTSERQLKIYQALQEA